MSERAGRYQRSFPGMIGAMIVLLLVVAAFVAFRDVNRNDPASPVKAVDYTGPAAFAQQEVDFPLLAPERLPDGWIATSVSFDRGRRPAWHVGMLTEAKKYVGLEQAPRTVAWMVERHVDEDADEGEQVVVAGRTWRSFTDSGGDLALARREGEVTTVVLGRVPRETLTTLIATLR